MTLTVAQLMQVLAQQLHVRVQVQQLLLNRFRVSVGGHGKTSKRPNEGVEKLAQQN